jgi:hypothetical protein
LGAGRDDAMALGLGGNDLRSLEFWIGEALKQGCDTLLVAGLLISQWKRQAIDQMASLFGGGGVEVEKLHAKIGQLLVERDFLARAFGRQAGITKDCGTSCRLKWALDRCENLHPRRVSLSLAGRCWSCFSACAGSGA